MVFTNVDSEHDFEFNKWYVEEHLPERLSAPGFLDGALYQATKGSPRYLAIYELESVAAMEKATALFSGAVRLELEEVKTGASTTSDTVKVKIFSRVAPRPSATCRRSVRSWRRRPPA